MIVKLLEGFKFVRGSHWAGDVAGSQLLLGKRMPWQLTAGQKGGLAAGGWGHSA